MNKQESCKTCNRGWRSKKPKCPLCPKENWKKRNSKLNAENSKEYRRKLRNAVVAFLGSQCVKCGFDDKRALQIDHVNGDGATERKNLTITQLHKKVLSDTEGNYQLLCANCNWIKKHENNEI